MEVDQYRQMAELQDRHWWFEAKRMIVGGMLQQLLSGAGPSGTDRGLSGQGQRPGWALEVGCGTGSMVPVLRRFGRLVGMDAHRPALRLIRGIDLVNGNLLALPFASEQFDLVGCFDVLYHRRVADVSQALAEIHRVCRPGGLVLITDAAGPRLMSAHDVVMHAARRFRLGDLSNLVRSAGFHVLHDSYYHTILFPVAAVLRLLTRALRGTPRLEPAHDARIQGRSALTSAPEWLNTALIRLYRVEARLVRQHRLPFGLSVLVAARRDPERRWDLASSV